MCILFILALMSISLTMFIDIHDKDASLSWTLIDSHAQICVCSELVANVANTTSLTSIVGNR